VSFSVIIPITIFFILVVNAKDKYENIFSFQSQSPLAILFRYFDRCLALLWLIVLITGLSLLRTEFSPKPSDAGCMVDTVILGHVTYLVFRFT